MKGANQEVVLRYRRTYERVQTEEASCLLEHSGIEVATPENDNAYEGSRIPVREAPNRPGRQLVD